MYRPIFVETGHRDGLLPVVWLCLGRGPARRHSGRCRVLVMSIVSPVSAKLMGQDWSLFAAVSWRCVSPSITVVESGFVMSVFVSVRRVISAVVVVFIPSRLLGHSLQK